MTFIKLAARCISEQKYFRKGCALVCPNLCICWETLSLLECKDTLEQALAFSFQHFKYFFPLIFLGNELFCTRTTALICVCVCFLKLLPCNNCFNLYPQLIAQMTMFFSFFGGGGAIARIPSFLFCFVLNLRLNLVLYRRCPIMISER